MRAVAEELGYTTSTVSQQLAVLAREAGTPLIEPEGRRVRLRPAAPGRGGGPPPTGPGGPRGRWPPGGPGPPGHAETILAAVEAARADLDPAAEPAGTVRVAGFASAIRRSLVPIIARLSGDRADVRLRVHEHEPPEAFALLAADEVDLALVYDYDLAPAPLPSGFEATPLWTTAWSLGVPAGRERGAPRDAASVFGGFAASGWIVNSRNTADEDVVRVLASLAGFEPEIAHHADSLELVQDLIVAGLGVGLLPADQPPVAGVALVPLRDPAVTLRSYAVTRRGRATWPPLALVARLLREASGG